MSSPGNSDSASGTDQQSPDSEKTSFMTTLDAKGDKSEGGDQAKIKATELGSPASAAKTDTASASSVTGAGSGSTTGTKPAAKSESRPDTPQVETPAAAPPWQRTTVAEQPSAAQSPDAVKPSGYSAGGAPAGPSMGAGGGEATTMTQPVGSGQQAGGLGRTAVTFPAGSVRPPGSPPGQTPGSQPPPRPVGSSPTGASRRPGRGPRRASLQIKRIDPWSVLKLTLVLSLAMFVVWLIAVGVLYGVLDGMQVWDQLNGTYNDLAGESADSALISAGRVFGVAAIIGAVNIVLFTALATVGAFVYNVSADLAGGIEVTLSERD